MVCIRISYACNVSESLVTVSCACLQICAIYALFKLHNNSNLYGCWYKLVIGVGGGVHA